MKKTNKIKKHIFIFVILFFAYIVYVYFASTSIIISGAGDKYQTIMSNCGYYALEKCIEDNFDFKSVCKFSRNKEGEIDFIYTDTLLVNMLCKELSLICYDFLNCEVKKGFDVPIGTFSGLRLFSGFGKSVNIKFATNVSVQCNFNRNFTSVGVNQTRQVLSLIVHTDVTLFTLLNKHHYDGDIEIILFDNLIIGKIPEVYLNNQTIASAKT